MDRLHNFGFLVKDISRLHSKNFERHALGLNMTLAQCKVLAHLQRNEGAPQVRLAELTDTDPMTLVRILDRMERDGWVERRADPGDRRARQLFLTKAALPVLQEMWRVADRARAEALMGLSAADREQLSHFLSTIQANLNSLLPAISAGDSTVGHARPISTRRLEEQVAVKSPARKVVKAKRPAADQGSSHGPHQRPDRRRDKRRNRT